MVPVLELALVDQAGLKLRDLPASASQVLGLKVCATTARHTAVFFIMGLAFLSSMDVFPSILYVCLP